MVPWALVVLLEEVREKSTEKYARDFYPRVVTRNVTSFPARVPRVYHVLEMGPCCSATNRLNSSELS